MPSVTLLFRLAALCLLVVGATACGDDATEAGTDAGAETGAETETDAEAGTEQESRADADPARPCTMLTEEEFASAIDVQAGEPEDVTGNWAMRELEETADQRCDAGR